jgi:hypothetical protein
MMRQENLSPCDRASRSAANTPSLGVGKFFQISIIIECVSCRYVQPWKLSGFFRGYSDGRQVDYLLVPFISVSCSQEVKL